jgi:methyl-accepting chemotaxis protein
MVLSSLFWKGPGEALGEFVKRVGVKGVPDDPLSLHVEELEVFLEGEPGYESAWREYKGFEIDYGTDELKAVDKEMLESLEWSKLHFAGMSGVFREEFSGVNRAFREEFAGMNKVFKEEFSGMSKSFREESAGTNRVFKEQFGDMNRVFREEIGGLKSEFKEMREDLKGGAVGIRGEIREMHSDMNSSFQEMAKRYDAISSELIRTRAELKRAVDTLVELVGKFVKER